MTRLLPFHLHALAIACIVSAGVLHWRIVKDNYFRRLALLALAALLVVAVWPVGDLAASVSLSVATFQRLVVMLLVAPLLLMSIPTDILVRLTKPPLVDRIVRVLGLPGVAIVLVTFVGTATLLSPVLDAGATNSTIRGLVVVVTLGAGVILWIPGLGTIPGTKKLSPVARAGYLFVSSLVVTSLSFIWIFSRHPLYPSLHHQQALLHVSPLLDQQLAGFVAKFGCYIPMWAVAFTIFSRADEEQRADESPLHWADVERQLLRIDRQRTRAQRRGSST